MTTKSALLNQETPGTVADDGHRIMVQLPVGSEILIIGPVLGHPEMVEVNWHGQSVWIFAVDLEARTKVHAAKGNDRPPLARATSVGADMSDSVADILPKTPNEADEPKNEEQKTGLTPRVRRFNAAGRELF